MMQSSRTSVDSYKLIQLEAIRGIASVIVLIHHFCIAFCPLVKKPYPVGLGGTPLYWMINGTGSVYLFFLLSGFVLTRRYFTRGVRGDALAMAVGKRLPRLIVPAGASLLLSWLVLRLGLGWYGDAGMLTGSAWLQTYAHAGFGPHEQPSLATALWQSVTVFFQPGATGLLNTNLWTMYYELFGSFLCFALVWLLSSFAGRLPIRAGVASVAIVAMVALMGIQSIPFLLGTIMARFYRYEAVALSKGAGAGLIGIGLLLCSVEWYSTQIVGALIIIATALACPWLAQTLSRPFGAFLGRYSFPIYLVHIMVLCTASGYVYVTLLHAGVPRLPVLLATAAVTLVLTFVVAIPFVMLEAWWVRRLNGAARAVLRRGWWGQAGAVQLAE